MAGLASFTDLSIETAGAGYTLVAQDLALEFDSVESDSFTITPAEATTGNSSIKADPSTGVVADGAQTSTLTITVLDAFENPVPGEPVFFSITDGDVGSGDVSPAPAGGWVTDGAGQATATLALRWQTPSRFRRTWAMTPTAISLARRQWSLCRARLAWGKRHADVRRRPHVGGRRD